MRVLGISAFHRDAAAALIVDGEVVAAAQEERYTRKPLDPAFPKRAIGYCLEAGGIESAELDRVVFYEKPLKKFERVLALHMKAFPRSARSFSRTLFLWLGDRLWVKNRILQELGVDGGIVHFTEHQLAVAANAYLTSPFEQAAVLTIDDAGEWATATLGEGDGRSVKLKTEVLFPHSLGLLDSAVTQYLGFVPGQEEFKREALGAFGTPRYADALRGLVGDQDGFFSLEQEPFRFAYDSERLYGPALEELLGPPRFSGDPLLHEGSDTRHADVAASLQVVLEESVLKLARALHEQVPSTHLCFAGELATNRSLNARLLDEGPFEHLWVPPSPSKAGAAIGAALYVYHQENEGRRAPSPPAALGESVDDRAEEGAQQLEADAVPAQLLQRLEQGQLVAWVRGRMEFGPHSLGNRSLLASALDAQAPRNLYGAIQIGEPFLPCRVAIPAERAAEYLDLPPSANGLLTYGLVNAKANDALREIAPAVIHADGTVWPQLVDASADPELHALLTAFGERAGHPLLVHADFAPRGSTLVRNEADAVNAFRRSNLDCLFVETRLYERS